MVIASKKYQGELKRIKKNIQNAYQYFESNCRRFNEFKKFAFVTTMNASEIAMLKSLNKPQIEFNVLEAYISRLRGEFSKQEPSIEVSQDFETAINTEIIQVVEGYLRHILFEANKDGCEYAVYSDLLAGGFSVLKVYTDYINSMSFNQKINIERVYDPTLCGFDPLARMSHKADGRFCFELFPKTEEEFKELYPNSDMTSIKFTRDIEGFNFSYQTEQEKILLVGDYYEKKQVKVKIVKLSNGESMKQADYDKYIEQWEEVGVIDQPPVITDSRMTVIEKICRYRIIENQVLEYDETDFSQLPLVFVDGNSVTLRDTDKGDIKQITRPYIYNAKGTQKLKNFAGQSLANELENSMQHKISVAKESIPNGYEEAYENVQLPRPLVYNAFKNDDPKTPLPPPQMIARTPIPPEFMNTFGLTDQAIQGILGSYDASLGINNNQLSGIAIVEGATQSNAAAMPYVVGFMQGLNQVAQIILDLIPKYYVTPRTIPIKKPDGEKTYVKINQEGGVKLKYPENALNVKVEAGLNFSVQKTKALQQIIAIMQASPLFAQFMNTDGLPVLLDNLEIKGIDQLKEMTNEFIAKIKKQQDQAQQKPDPQVLRAETEQAKVKQKAQEAQTSAQLKAAEIAVEKQKDDTDRLELMSTLTDNRENRLVQLEKAQTEKVGKAVDLGIKVADMSHKHAKDVMNLLEDKK